MHVCKDVCKPEFTRTILFFFFPDQLSKVRGMYSFESQRHSHSVDGVKGPACIVHKYVPVKWDQGPRLSFFINTHIQTCH